MTKDNIENNKELIEKFPFLLPHNRWTNKVSNDYDYSYTELDAMPHGWRKAFGLQMCEEILSVLKEDDDLLEKYRILQIKEKWGSLRWYDNFTTDGLSKVIDKYKELSMRTCIDCGEPATKISMGWISPYCDSCANKLEEYDEHFMPIEEYYSKDKL